MEQLTVFGILGLVLVLFITNRLRYDVVAMLALLAVTLTGTVPQAEAFAGFGHPAVITVAAVLMISRGLMNAGVVDFIAVRIGRVSNHRLAHIGLLCGATFIFSGFMNNVGALALLMPVAIRLARKGDYSPSLSLMPLAFTSLLGGTLTLIGTPPNLIIASYREPSFAMFDFLPVGLALGVVGLTFVVVVGWRFIPQRSNRANDEWFKIEEYVTEVRLTATSKLIGKPISHLPQLTEADVVVVAIIRNKQTRLAPSRYANIEATDHLIIEADPEKLPQLLEQLGLELVGDKPIELETLKTDEFTIIEAIVTARAWIRQRSAKQVNLRGRYGINLLAVARQGSRLRERLGDIRFRGGDVLLLQGGKVALQEALPQLGCLPLAERDLPLGKPRRLLTACLIFGVGLAFTATGILAVQVALMAAAIAMILTNIINLREAYESIDLPILVLLGAMIPVGQALETSGGAQTIADGLLVVGEMVPTFAMLVLLMVCTMALSNIMNNAATAVLMAPIAINVALGLEQSADPFLMVVAIGSSCAFLTPIGHQSNTLVMGPGGYQFGDYWQMGLPLSVLVVLVGTPLIWLVWR